MERPPGKDGLLKRLRDYLLNLQDSSPYWRVQAAAWGVILTIVICAAGFFAVLALYSIFGGGTITYEAKGSPGPVKFSHYTHMWFKDGKYKKCESCHSKLFAAEKYGTFVFRALRDSPPRKFRIGKDISTLFVSESAQAADAEPVTYEVPRACTTCATGDCHDGKESFGRLECLKCHQRR